MTRFHNSSDRILIVDDDASTLMSLKRHLSRHFNVTTAASAKDASDLIDRGEVFDSILCDMRMPGLSGYDFLQFARSQNVVTPFVFLSGDVDTLVQSAELERLGVAAVLMKPTPIPEIVEALVAAHVAHFRHGL